MKSASPVALTLLLSAVLFGSGCRSPYYADRGAFWGGLTGLATGAAIGKHNGNTMAGALIGTAAGTMAGTAIGQTIDDEVARNQAEIEARMGRRLAGATKIEDVVAMSQAGLSDQVIITHINANGVARRPSAAELIRMKDQGVKETVLDAMLTAPPPAEPRTARAPRPVVIEEHYYGHPYYHRPYDYHFHHRHRHHRHRHVRPGVHWGVSVSN